MKETKAREDQNKPTTAKEALSQVERDAYALKEHFNRAAGIRDALSDALTALRALLGTVNRDREGEPPKPMGRPEVDLSRIFGGRS